MEQEILQDEPKTGWKFYYDNGGRAFDLWRDVLETYHQSSNFMVNIGLWKGAKFQIDWTMPNEYEILSRLMRTQARLKACGYQINPPLFKDDPIGFFEGMLGFLVLIEGSLLLEAANGFNNEAPSRAPIQHA